ncbi:MAG: exonuclease domain-containing protein [Candidatus Omnitrophica bacterium]|nr:exonuclease domain-containing protein [Candidatus Omnitrophota bacterium]
MKIAKAEFTIFDVETTGLFPYSGDRICEIAAVRVNSSCKNAKKFSSLVDPQRPISYGAFSVNGITSEMVAGEPTIDKVLPKFLNFAEGSVLVAYNAGFDLGFLESAMGENKDKLNDYFVIDALALARRFFPDAGRYNLGTIAKHLNIKTSGEHRALADASATWKVFEKELAMILAEGIEDIEAIAYSRPDAAVKKVKDYRTSLIKEAIQAQKKLNITYRSSWDNRVTKRVITPIQIQNAYDRSYVVAFCHLKNTERNFRIDCIVDAEMVSA